MILSVLSRRANVRSREEWETRLNMVRPRIEALLSKQPGFVSVQFLYSGDSEGEIADITTWQSLEDCRRYLRGGAAATVATMSDAVLPSAPYPYGTWYRRNYEVPDGSALGAAS